MKLWKNRLMGCALAGMLGLGAVTGTVISPQQAEAGGVLVDVLGTAIAGTMYRDKVMGVYKTYNNTDKGRQEWFEQMKKEEGVDEDEYLNSRLDTIMSNVTAGIAAVDPTVYKKPYNYFISPNDDANAYCTIGHNVNVYRGIFNLMPMDDEIAVVIGHELGHGQKDHPLQGVKKSLNAAVPAEMANAATGGIASGAIGQLYTYTRNVHLSKPMEWEADNLAFDYITHTNYNPGATAAVWQRFLEKYGDMNIHWSDHPTCTERRENYVKKLNAWSNKHVDDKDGVVYVNKKEFLTPSATGSMSSKERSYFVMGNLAAVYHNNKTAPEAYASGDTVMMGQQPIITSTGDDPSAEELAAKLNKIK